MYQSSVTEILKVHETNRLADFPRAKRSAETKYNSFPLLLCIQLLSTDLDGSVSDFTAFLFLQNPQLHFML